MQKLICLRCFLLLLFFGHSNPAEDHTGLITGVVIAVLVLLFIVGCFVFYIYRKYYHTGHYNLHRNIHCCKKHSPVPTSA